jgi:hypothetical protein
MLLFNSRGAPATRVGASESRRGRLLMATSASPPDNPLSPILTGGWQCGAVGYALLALPERVHICHCRMCQKAVGGPFASWAPVRGGHLTWKRGTVTTFASSSTTRRCFCGKCGTPLTFQYIDGDRIAVTIGIARKTSRQPSRSASRADWAGLTRLIHFLALPPNQECRPSGNSNT